jgi:ketosteroid isomerase-like protein
MGNEIEPNATGESTLERLNKEYVEAYMSADVHWYERHLADDFVCIESDGSLLNKVQFLSNTAEGPDVADYKLEKVHVRIYGGVGLVHATGLFTRKDGTSGVSRYTDVYLQTGEGWKAVSAQITRQVPALNATTARD